MSDSEKVRPVTRCEFWWVFGGLLGAFLFLAWVVVTAWDGSGECDGSIPGQEQCDGNILQSGLLLSVVLALFAIAWGLHFYLERRGQ